MMINMIVEWLAKKNDSNCKMWKDDIRALIWLFIFLLAFLLLIKWA